MNQALQVSVLLVALLAGLAQDPPGPPATGEAAAPLA